MESKTSGTLAAFRKKDLSEKVVRKMGSIKSSACCERMGRDTFI